MTTEQIASLRVIQTREFKKAERAYAANDHDAFVSAATAWLLALTMLDYEQTMQIDDFITLSTTFSELAADVFG